MRDIKFRIWNKMDKKFHTYKKLDTTKWLIDLNGNLGYMDLEDFSWGGLIPRGFYELNQYTGLKDKFGKEIYEGDFILCDRNISDKIDNLLYEVKFSDGRYVFKSGINEIMYDDLGLGEVIGNIYENPELLEECMK